MKPDERPVHIKNWLVFYTKSRAEKRTLENLVKFGYQAYLPLRKVVRQWSDRKKKLEVPLFNSYIFVFENTSTIPEILQIPGIAWNIRYNQQPAILRVEELEMIKRFLVTGLTIETSAVEKFEHGEKVKVIDGPLKGFSGILVGNKGNEKFSVILQSIDQQLKVKIDKRLLKKIIE